MKRSTTIILAGAAVLVLGGGTVAVRTSRGAGEGGEAGVLLARRGVLVDRALAVGTIEPEVEISVKSKISGVVQRRYAEPGDLVRAGAPLLEIRPDPTPLELAEARRQVELRELDAANLKKELERKEELRRRELLAPQEYEAAQRSYREAVVQLQMARERLQLLEKGRVTIANDAIESVVRSPIDGYILEEKVEVGDPVVPLSTYQEGTVLLTMADMGHLLFRGTVDEIDVGRLKEGMPVEIKIGALPGAHVTGVLSKISLKAQKEDNATKFPVEVRLDRVEGVTLRAGYSANAEIIIQKKENALQIPERTVTFEGDSAWVNVPGPDGKPQKRYIRTGLSDAINIEVVSGLRDGERVLEKPTRDVK